MKPRTFMRPSRGAIGLLLLGSLPLAATLRSSPINLILLVDGSDSGADQEARQIAVKALCAAARDGDHILLAEAGFESDLPRPLAAPGNILWMPRSPQRDIIAALEETAHRLTDPAFSSSATLCVILGSSRSPAPPLETVNLLPPNTHIRLIGPAASANVGAFNAVSSTPLDIKQAQSAQLPEASAELIREMPALRTYRPTAATALLCSVYLASGTGFLARRRRLHGRRLHLLWETNGSDETVEILEGQERTVAGQTVRRENGRVALALPQASEPTRVWKCPGDTLELLQTDGEVTFVHIV